MCEGEFESLKAIHAVSPGFVPQPYSWGKYTQEDPETYFLLAEFRDVGKQVRTPDSRSIRTRIDNPAGHPNMKCIFRFVYLKANQ